jgi:endonuclease/exonuclease/phosphatase family metal-dependent hydrolase
MRLVSYNILDGGDGRGGSLLQVIRRQEPDLVALVEAEDPAVVVELADGLKMDFIHAPGNTKASALLSRFPICQTVNHAVLHPKLSKSMLEVIVVGPGGLEWTIGVLHLHARAAEQDEQLREREIARVLRIFATHRSAGRPHLLTGDFNSNAPYQRIDPQRCKPSTREAWRQNGGFVPRRVVQSILDAGYLDSLYIADRDRAQTGGSFSTEFPGQRVDYIFTFGFEPSRIREAWIDNIPPAREASDHFSIGVKIT